MHEKIRDAFDSVHAEQELKDKTRAAIARRAHRRAPRWAWQPMQLAMAGACAAAVVVGGSWLYLTPTVHISIDVNPSLELGVNRFDRVVSVKGYNEDGRMLADSVHVTFMDYTDAVNEILQSDTVESLLAGDAVLEIGVIGNEGTQREQMMAAVQTCTEDSQNTYCYTADTHELEEAHENGLSYGKYRAYLELQAVDPDATPEEVQGLTMREIHDLIDEHCHTEDTTDATGSSVDSCEEETEDCGDGEHAGNGQQAGTANGNAGTASGNGAHAGNGQDQGYKGGEEHDGGHGQDDDC